MPRLLSNPPPGKVIQELLGMPSSNKKQWLDFVNRFQKSTLNPERVSVSDAKRFGSYNAGGLPPSAQMKTQNGPVSIRDIKGSGNIMFNQSGRPYLTDPYII